MRSFTSVVAWLAAVVAGVLTVPLLWISSHVVDEDGYVAFSSELATDTELQGAFAAYLADDFVQRGALPKRLQKAATSALSLVGRQTSNQPGFVEAWEQTQRSFHQSAFSDDSGPLMVEAGPLADFVVQRLDDALPVSLQVPGDLTVEIGTADDRRAVDRLSMARTFGLLGLLVVIVAGVTSLLSARSRPLAIAGLGVGALVVAGVVRVATSVVTPRIIDETRGTTEFAQSFQKLLVDRASDSLSGWLVWVAAAGAAAVAVGLVGRLVAGRSR